MPPSRTWNIYCRVIDNFGDVGVCWRLASDLAARGQRVRLVLDETSTLVWMAPAGQAGVAVCGWPGPADPGEVVIEAFGCELPPATVATMQALRAARREPPLWLNLEYLSAEPYVERSHALPSPQPGGLLKWFFFPGFSARTGGLIREPGLLAARAAFDAGAWLARWGITRRAGERVVSLFCYDAAPLAAWFAAEAGRPTLLLATPGPAQALAAELPPQPALRIVAMPWLPQTEYDRLLWVCDLNFVRGEDSLVRALWAGAPFVWQAYRQNDGAHLKKLEALIEALALPADVAALWRAWNHPAGFARWPDPPDFATWRAAAVRAAAMQAALPDLVTQLLAFSPPSAAPHASVAASGSPPAP
jgi:uncharacterized repeat protein (TIGR03837 family)